MVFSMLLVRFECVEEWVVLWFESFINIYFRVYSYGLDVGEVVAVWGV